MMPQGGPRKLSFFLVFPKFNRTLEFLNRWILEFPASVCYCHFLDSLPHYLPIFIFLLPFPLLLPILSFSSFLSSSPSDSFLFSFPLLLPFPTSAFLSQRQRGSWKWKSKHSQRFC